MGAQHSNGTARHCVREAHRRAFILNCPPPGLLVVLEIVTPALHRRGKNFPGPQSLPQTRFAAGLGLPASTEILCMTLTRKLRKASVGSHSPLTGNSVSRELEFRAKINWQMIKMCWPMLPPMPLRKTIPCKNGLSESACRPRSSARLCPAYPLRPSPRTPCHLRKTAPRPPPLLAPTHLTALKPQPPSREHAF